MALQDDLLALERQFWTKGADFYRQALDRQCLVAFTEMAGVMSPDQIAGTVGDVVRWRDVEIDVEGLLQPEPTVAILTYRVQAMRDGSSYRALVSSLYVQRDGAWKMAFHQQTPDR